MASTHIVLVSVLLAFLHCGHCQYPVQACCDLKLMDATQQVAIETGKPLATGTFTALRVRSCTTDTVLIQVWTLQNNSSVQLKWQTSLTSTTAQNGQAFVTLGLNTPLTITANDRLGVYGSVADSNWMKVSIPYELDSINGATYFTQFRYANTDAFSIGLQTQLDTVLYPRTFSTFVNFCSASDCSDLPAASSPSPPPTTQTCGCPKTCSPNQYFDNVIKQQSASTNALSDQVQQTNEIVDALISSTVQTGQCPSGMLSGSYGLGSCYVLVTEPKQQPEAAVLCGNLGANLVEIDSEVEEDFLFQVAINATAGSTVVSFWTSAIFSSANSAWYWYRQDGSPSPRLAQNNYQNWINGAMPTPTTNSEIICMVLTIDLVHSTHKWNVTSCSRPPAFYICERPKQCF